MGMGEGFAGCQGSGTSESGESPTYRRCMVLFCRENGGLKPTLRLLRGDVRGLQADVAVTRADVAEVRRSIDLAETVAAMKRQIEKLEAEVAGLKRRA